MLLFKRMMKDAGYNDPELANLLVAGISLCGDAGDCADFPERRTEQRISIEQLMMSSRWTRKIYSFLEIC